MAMAAGTRGKLLEVGEGLNRVYRKAISVGGTLTCGSIELGTSCGRRSTVLCSSARGRRRAWSMAGVHGNELRMV